MAGTLTPEPSPVGDRCDGSGGGTATGRDQGNHHEDDGNQATPETGRSGIAPDRCGPAVSSAFRLPRLALAITTGLLALSMLLGIALGPAGIPFRGMVLAVLDALPVVSFDHGLTDTQQTILWQWRVPRVALGGLVGAALALSGASYQGVFRNPLADPYLLGVAAGAGLGATLALSSGLTWGAGPVDLLTFAAFAGALAGVGAAYVLGRGAGASGSVSLILAGVAVAAFLTACQTFVMQRHADTLREVYAWLLGRLSTSGWTEVQLLAVYFVVCGAVLLAARRQLDVLRLGEDEAIGLGVDPARVRLVVVVAASLLTAAAVSVSGLIAFVGIIVPHLIRLAVGSSYRIVLPLSAIGGAAFLILADVGARTVMSPSELPIGVITSFVGAPFFGLVLWHSRRSIAS